MDFGNLKGRIGEALVENIFHLAGYRVARLGRESDVQRLLKDGEDEFSPDFLVWKPVDGMPGAFWLLNVEVKYRRDLADFFRFGGAEKLTQAKQRWPDLYFVFVTDHPAAGRSCFQAMCLRDYTPGEEPKLVDLHQFSALDIYPSTVAAHEMIAQDLFTALTSARRPARCATSTRRSEGASGNVNARRQLTR